MAKKWWLDIAIPVGGEHLDEADFDFAKKLREFVYGAFGNRCDSGIGFGVQEFNYHGESEEELEFFRARVKRELAKEFGEEVVKLSKFEIRQY